MKTKLTSLVLMLASAAAVAQSDGLKAAVRKAVTNNPEVTARFHSFKAAVEEVDVARGAYFPKLDLSADTGRQNEDNTVTGGGSLSRRGASLTLSQMLWDGLATRNEVRRLGHAKMTRYFELVSASEESALEASRAYYDVRRFRRLVELAEDSYVQHKAAFDQIQARVKAGVGRGVDLEQASGRLALAESNLITELSNLHDVSARYQRIVGELPSPDMPDPGYFDEGLPSSSAQALLQAQTQSSMIAAAVENLRSVQSQAKRQDSAFQPRLEARLRDSSGRNLGGTLGRSSETVAEIVLNWNLYNGGSDHARVRQVAQLLNNAADLRDKACREVRQTVAIAYNDTKKLTEQLKFLDTHQLSIEKARDAYRKQFDIGQRTLLDVLNAENELYQARRAYANAAHDLAIAYLRTYAGMNVLLPILELSKLDTGELPEADRWEAGKDAAARCPAEPPITPTVDKASLDAKAKLLMVPAALPTEAPIPAPILPAAAPATESSTDRVMQRLRNWAIAWSAKDFDAYMNFYSPDFQPTRMSVEAWHKQRRVRVTKKGTIRVTLEDIRIKQISPERIEATFTQVYKSSDYSDTITKTLGFAWVKVQDQWLIVSETNR